jgi:hypothetical protein
LTLKSLQIFNQKPAQAIGSTDPDQNPKAAKLQSRAKHPNLQDPPPFFFPTQASKQPRRRRERQQSKREGRGGRTAIAHQRSALSVSQISRLTAQSGPCSRWLVALSTRDAAGSRAGGGPVATGYITPPSLAAPLAAAQGKAASQFRRAAGRGSGVVRRYGALEIRRQSAREEERSKRRKAGGLGNQTEEGSKRKRGRGGRVLIDTGLVDARG